MSKPQQPKVRVKAENTKGFIEIDADKFDRRIHEQFETDFAATHRDEHAGHGGEYTVRDGKRVLLHRARLTPPVPGGKRSDDPKVSAKSAE